MTILKMEKTYLKKTKNYSLDYKTRKSTKAYKKPLLTREVKIAISERK